MADKSNLLQRVKDHIALAEKLADDRSEAHRIRGWFAASDQLTHELLELAWAGHVTPEKASLLTRRLGRALRRVERGPVWTRLEQRAR